MNIKKLSHQLLNFITSYRVLLVWLLILLLLGFTLWQTLKISDPQIDTNYLERQRSEAEKRTTSLELNEDLEAKINRLESAPVDTSLTNLGTRDPFNP